MNHGPQIEEKIASEARRLGFVAVGGAPLDAATSLAIFEQWIESGMAAGMDYLRRNQELRQDPRNLAPGARSIIVVAAAYPVNRAPGSGFSTYCRGRDYHDVMRDKLKLLVTFLRTLTPISVARICVDSAPLFEREWAVRAGIGWRGHQGQIVNAAAGCCLVLGEVLVDVELAPSAPAEHKCGDCRKCLDACPSGALQPNGQVDARRCLSYATIEHKGEINPTLEKTMGRTLFGCDLCTAVCPWNPKDDSLVMPELANGQMPDAETLLAMDEAIFKQQFKGTAILRTGLERLQRNARVAQRNRRDSQ